ncbi:MAG: FHA domain-containing protein [Bacteroidaceae bacterium]|nr:FHA domain-containing protein [Bacteroidaceae bacterium]
MEIIIGRESTSPLSIGGRLHILTSNKKDYYLGLEGSVPKSVSRQHCKIIIKTDGSMELINLKPTNITYINGIEVIRKTISKSDRIELGGGHFVLDLNSVLDTVKTEIPQSYDISHLKAVWEKYQQTKIEIQVKQSKSAAVQSVTGLLSMASIACGFVPGVPDIIRGVLYGIAIILAVVFFIYRMRHAGENVLQLKELDDQFHKDYVCPNPDCGRFLGVTPYDDLKKQTKSCPVCKAVYEVKE